MVGLGQVDEFKVEGKGPRQPVGLHQVEGVNAVQGRGELGAFFSCVLRFAAADGDLPQLFHFGEQRLACLLAQNLAEQHAEGTNVAP